MEQTKDQRENTVIYLTNALQIVKNVSTATNAKTVPAGISSPRKKCAHHVNPIAANVSGVTPAPSVPMIDAFWGMIVFSAPLRELLLVQEVKILINLIYIL